MYIARARKFSACRGKMRRSVGQHDKESSFHLRLRRQPDNPRDDAGGVPRAMDAKKKLQEIAAKKLGGKPEQYEVANERVFRKGGGAGMTLAQAAKHAIQLGGVYDGHEAPADVHKLTKASVAALAGQGLVAAAKDNYPRDGSTFSYVASFAEVEVDVETGKYYIVDFLASADVGTVIHPRALGGQVLGRSTLGIGHAIGQKWVFDPHYGQMVSKRFHHNKPPTILDVPVDMQWTALDIPDPETPVGARGVGEPPVAGGCAFHLERPLGCSGGRDFPARTGERRHDSDVARSGPPDAASPDGPHLIEI